MPDSAADLPQSLQAIDVVIRSALRSPQGRARLAKALLVPVARWLADRCEKGPLGGDAVRRAVNLLAAAELEVGLEHGSESGPPWCRRQAGGPMPGDETADQGMAPTPEDLLQQHREIVAKLSEMAESEDGRKAGEALAALVAIRQTPPRSATDPTPQLSTHHRAPPEEDPGVTWYGRRRGTRYLALD